MSEVSLDTRGKFPFPKAAGPSRPQCILCRGSKWHCRRPETALEGPFSGTGRCSQLGSTYAVPRGSRSLQRGGKPIPLRTVGLGHSFLGSPQKLSPALLLLPKPPPPGARREERAGPRGTRGAFVWRVAAAAAEERIARVPAVAGVWTRTFFRPPHELRHSRCPTTPARKAGAPR